jgi:RNA polymerase sigma factor (sigma-70 family)
LAADSLSDTAMNRTDTELLRAFADSQSEDSFRHLVDRHLPLVLGTARRLTADSGAAEDIAQRVFILLARKAPRLSPGVILSGWLYRVTRFTASRFLRSEERRRRREQEAILMNLDPAPDPSWKALQPFLDDALTGLSETDRNAVLLRYFQDCSVREVSARLGLSEEAAGKRLQRALEKLQKFFKRKGVQISAATLATGLASERVQAGVRSGIAAKICADALQKSKSGVAPTGASLLANAVAAWQFLVPGWIAISSVIVIGASGLLLVTMTTLEKTGSEKPTPAVVASSVPSAAPLSVVDTNEFPASVQIGGTEFAVKALTFRVLDAVSSEPVAGARVATLGFTMDGVAAPRVTGTNGIVKIPYLESFPGDDRLSQFPVFVRREGYGSRQVQWLSTTGSVLRAVGSEYTVKLSPGIRLRGTVVNEQNEPLPGIQIGAFGSNYRGYTVSSTDGVITSPPIVRVDDFSSYGRSSDATNEIPLITDSNGTFELPDFPADLRGVVVELKNGEGARHRVRTPAGSRLTAESLPEISFEDLVAGRARIVLPEGATVVGIVLDETGQPVGRASVVEASQPGNLTVLSRNTTDANGQFVLRGRPERETIFTVSAEGFADVSRAHFVKRGEDPLRIELRPAIPLRGRVVDETGRPLAGVTLKIVDYMNEGVGFQWETNTDDEGRFVWKNAPTNQLSIMAAAPMGIARVFQMKAAPEEQTFTLPLKLPESISVSGTVTDAETGAVIPEFSIQVKPWERKIEGRNGEFRFQLFARDFFVGNAPVWEFETQVDDYETARTRQYYFEEGDQQVKVEVRRGGNIHGVVRQPDGNPASGAYLGISVKNRQLPWMDSERLQLHYPGTGRTDGDGLFKIKKPPGARAFLVIHESGWAVQSIPEKEEKLNVRLAPWGKVEGTVLMNGSPLAGEVVGLRQLVNEFTEPFFIAFSATTDSEGHFAFHRVIPGEYRIGRNSRAWQRMGHESVEAWETPVEVGLGETKVVRLSSSGRTVTAMLQPIDGAPAGWWSNSVAVLRREVFVAPLPSRADYVSSESHDRARERRANDPAFRAALREQRNFVSLIGEDGSVRFESVPPGRYVLEATIYPPEKPNVSPQPSHRVSAKVSVPEDDGSKAASDVVHLGSFPGEPR